MVVGGDARPRSTVSDMMMMMIGTYPVSSHCYSARSARYMGSVCKNVTSTCI